MRQDLKNCIDALEGKPKRLFYRDRTRAKYAEELSDMLRSDEVVKFVWPGARLGTFAITTKRVLYWGGTGINLALSEVVSATSRMHTSMLVSESYLYIHVRGTEEQVSLVGNSGAGRAAHEIMRMQMMQ